MLVKLFIIFTHILVLTNGRKRKLIEKQDGKVCHDVKSLLDISQWPDIVFYEDHPDFVKAVTLDPNREENVKARATVAEFNRIRNSVLTTTLLDEGITEGSLYAAQSFAQHFLARENNSRPLLVAVTGNSFTIGSNCAENTRNLQCAWPNRLAQRWRDIITRTFGNTINSKIEWKMLQRNAQSSNNVMYNLPSLIEECRLENKTLDVIILNNAITDMSAKGAVWFEAVIRVLLEHFPRILIISILDGLPRFVENHQELLERYNFTQNHYNLTRIDFAKMCRVLKYSDEKSYKALRQQYPQSSLLWPQVPHMMYPNGTIIPSDISDIIYNGLPQYWANYTPRVEKMAVAHYPTNHPPWPTHQYVADSVLYTLLSVLKTGMGCDDSRTQREIATQPPLPEIVTDKNDIRTFTACLKPIDQLDAQVLTTLVTETGTNSDKLSVRKSPVVVTCGKWEWITDARKRSGWQSDKAGSMIKFRLKVSEIPIISLTYMTSHATFGNLRVAIQPISKADTTPLLGCSDVAKFANETLLPSFRLSGKSQKYSLWATHIFSGRLDSKIRELNNFVEKTLINKMRNSKDIEYIDMYILNDGAKIHEQTVKIKTVLSC